jgi:hypothetical protein
MNPPRQTTRPPLPESGGSITDGSGGRGEPSSSFRHHRLHLWGNVRREPRQLSRLDGEVTAAADIGWGHETGRAGEKARKCKGGDRQTDSPVSLLGTHAQPSAVIHFAGLWLQASQSSPAGRCRQGSPCQPSGPDGGVSATMSASWGPRDGSDGRA